MEGSLSRLHQSIDYLKNIGKVHKQQDIANTIGMAKTHLSVALKGGNYFTVGFLQRFAAAYSDYINESWLLTGEGEMAKPSKDLRPHFEQKVSAGFMTVDNMAEIGDDLRPLVAGIPDYDFTIMVQGDSMEPLIMEGDILACRKTSDRQNPPMKKICVIDNRDGGPVVKMIDGTTDDCLILRSLNEKYPVRETPFEEINGIALVVGMVRNFN